MEESKKEFKMKNEISRIDKTLHLCKEHILEGMNVPPFVYHYTSFRNFQNFFVESADIMAMHSAVLNDKNEVKTGFGLFCNTLKEAYHGVENEELISRLWKEFLSCRTGIDRMPYVFSLTSEDNSLPQWRAYTDIREGGYSMAFRTKDILDAVDANMRCENRNGWFETFMPCVYTSDAELVRAVIHQELTAFQDVFDAYFNGTEQGLLHRVTDLIIILSSFIKDGGFEAEKEWRLIVKPQQFSTVITRNNNIFTELSHGGAKIGEDLFNPEIQILNGKPCVPTGLRNLNLRVASLINDIVISPHGDEDKLETVSVAILRKNGLTFTPRRKSTIPYECR